MKFGVREICDVVFKALQSGKLGNMNYEKGQPVLYIDTAKTSTIEGASTTVYATGGRGNTRLIAWEGEKTLTFTVEDALLSEIGFAILSGAGLFDIGKNGGNGVAQVHCIETPYTENGAENAKILKLNKAYSTHAPVFVMKYENGSITEKVGGFTINNDSNTGTAVITLTGVNTDGQYFVDYYTDGFEAVTELQIDAENFAGYYYVEASTLFKRESDGKDFPAEIVFPKVKIQSNFTFNMAATGDPSTFTFTMDAMPAYTMFQKDKKVLCAIQVIDDTAVADTPKAVTTLNKDANVYIEKAGWDGDGGDVLNNDSVTTNNNI